MLLHPALRQRPQALRLALCALLLAAAPVSAGDACLERLVASLGWQLSPGDTLRIEPGQPCERASRDAAIAAGDLRATLPAHATPAERELLLRGLLEHPATACAFAFDHGAASQRAIDKLVANDGFRFSAMQTGWIGFGAGGPARDGWESLESFKRRLRPLAEPSRAIEAFYTGTVRGECGLGRQAAQYAAQAELYGMPGFDAEFDRDEIIIGTFVQLQKSRSILLGSGAGRYAADGLAVKASALGRQAFVGQPGFVVHDFGREFLDDINNQAQNFVVYAVDAAAEAELREHGGFAHYNAVNRELWRLSRTVQRGHIDDAFERLLLEDDPKAWKQLSAGDVATVERIRALLDDPFYRGFHIYVHRRGVKPVRYHLARMLDINPRTPYRVELSLSNVHTTLMQRYFAHRLRVCAAGSQKKREGQSLPVS